jgi:putative ABC transport system permease protein
MSLLSDLVVRLQTLIFRRREERDLDEELRTHVEMEAEHRRKLGQPDADARRESLVRLGGVERVKEEVRDARGTRLLDNVVADIAFTIRTLFARPGFSLVAILTLAIGIGGTTAVFSAVDAVLLQPLPYQQPGQLVRLFQNDVAYPDDRGFVTPVHFLAFRKLSTFQSAAALYTYSEIGADIGVGDRARRIRLLPASADYFDVVRVHPEIGAGFQREHEEGGANVVVLSHKLWEDEFHGDPSVVGKSFTMNGRPYSIAGVMPSGFSDPVAGAVDAWTPTDLSPGRDPSNADNHYITVIARLRPDVSLQRAQAELEAMAVALAKQYPDAKDARARLYSLKEETVGSSRRALEMMLGAVGLVLLLVCVNVANLLLVRGSERAGEFALRSALGADRSRLVRQMLIESLTLAFAGAAASLVISRLAMWAIVALGAGNIPRLASLSLDVRLLAFSFALATVSAVGFGLAPALRAARTQPGDILRDGSRSATGGVGVLRTREWLVISQVALAFILVVGAGLLISSFSRMRHLDLGIKSDDVLTFELSLPSARYDSSARGRFYDDLPRAIEEIPGVRAAGAISRLPATGGFHVWGIAATTGPLANSRNGSASAQQRVVAGDYFRAVGIPLLRGRLFDATDRPDGPRHVVVSKDVGDRLFPGVDPIGQRFRTGGREVEIIGVVAEVAVDNEGRAARTVYHAHRQFASREWILEQVIAVTGSVGTVQGSVRRLLASRDPQLVMYKPTLLDDAIGVAAAQRVFTLRILSTFAALAIGLAALGLFGFLSYGVRLRARELSIRIALGAEGSAIRRLILRRGLVVTGVGLAIGLVGAMTLSRLMASALFQVSPFDPSVLAGAMVVMTLIGAVAAYLPARRATTADPVATLRA